ncbi:phage tail protein [Raoultella planticola]|nr:phage tail protein [Raoultella planticola]
MKKVGSTTDTADSNGEYTNGNVANGVPPTIINAEMLNTFQRELVAVVEGAGITLDPANDAQVLAAINALVGSGRLLNVQIFHATAIYNKTPGTKNVIVEVQAAGGSGGNTGFSGASSVSLATGGSGGGYAKSRLTAAQADGKTVTVGSAGQPATGYPSTGNPGGDSSFGNLITCKGGNGGFGQDQATPPFTCTAVTGGDATGGNIINIPGGSSAHGVSVSTTSNFVGNGGGSFLGEGGFGPANNNTPGSVGRGFGAGGGGAVGGPNNTATGYKGAAGTDGIVIVWEYA